MKRLILPLIGALAVAALASAPAAVAASPHYVKGPTATVSDNSLVVSWKAAGLGNTATSVDFTLTGTVTTTSQCFTKSGNPVNGSRSRRRPMSTRPGPSRSATGR